MQSRIVSDATTDIKGLKRPDKALPCPRCNSFDTKFCYYNNYSVNQPRHFCKGCQRYWTAGGALRNVAIGAGRRKRKHTSLESDSVTDDSASEHYNNIHDLSPIEFLGNLSCGSTEAEFAHTRSSEVVKQPKALPSAAASNPLSLNVAGSASYVYTHSRQIVASCNRVAPFCNSRSVREPASTFHEFLHSDHITAAQQKKVSNSHALAYESAHLEQMATGSSSGFWAESPRNGECIDLGSKLVSSTASTRQASNESGCASSVTTLAASVDACATDRQSEAMDSEVAKEGDEVDKGGSLNETPSLVLGGASSTSSFVHCNASSVVTRAPMPGPLENPAVGAALPLLSSSGLMWGPPADRALFWGFPWGPAAKAVDAAKAALIPQVGLSQKHQQTEQNANASSEMRLWFPKTVRIKDADEAVRSSIWSTLGIRDRQGSVLPEKAKEAFQCHAKEVDVLSIQSQYANPAALTQSMAFQESS